MLPYWYAAIERSQMEVAMIVLPLIKMVHVGKARELTRGQWHVGIPEMDGTYIRQEG